MAAEMVDTSSPQVWVDWGSYAAVVVVVGEREVPRGPLTGTTEAPLELPSNRGLTLRIESIVWEHPGAILPLGAGDEIEVLAGDGWVDVDGEKVPIVTEGQARPEVGQTYLLVLGEVAEADPTAFEVFAGSVVPLVGGQVDRAGSAVDGRSPEQVAAELAELQPDPDRAPVAGETLQERVLRVLYGG